MVFGREIRVNRTFTISLRISEKLDEYSRRTGIPRSHIVEQALKEFFERHPLEFKIRGGEEQ